MKKDTDLHTYIRNWDPMDFIAEGAPQDEYDAEADEIMSRFTPGMDATETGLLVYEVFTQFMEIDPKNFKNECILRGKELLTIISNRLN